MKLSSPEPATAASEHKAASAAAGAVARPRRLPVLPPWLPSHAGESLSDSEAADLNSVELDMCSNPRLLVAGLKSHLHVLKSHLQSLKHFRVDSELELGLQIQSSHPDSESPAGHCKLGAA